MMKTIGSLLLTLSLLGNVAYATDYEAIIDFADRRELSLPVSGVIKTLNIVAGQKVKKGDELLSLDQSPFKATRVHAQSRVAVQKTLLSESQRDFNNRQELFDRTVLATVQLENAELKVKRDQAFLKSAESQLAIAEYELSYSRLLAPFGALILSVHVNPGQSINNAIASKTLISLARQGSYLARFSVPAGALNKLEIGQSISVDAQGKSYQAVISSIAFGSVTSGDTHTATVEAGFSSAGNVILAGSKASVQITE